MVEVNGRVLAVLPEVLLSVRQFVDVFPVIAEVRVVVAVLPAHLADVDGPRQLLVVQLPLRVQDVGGDLAVRTKSVLTIGKFVDLGPVSGGIVVRGLILLSDLQQEQQQTHVRKVGDKWKNNMRNQH